MIQGERGWTPSTHNVVWPWSPSSTAPILKNKTKKGSVFNIMCTLTLSTLLRCWLATCCLIAAIPVQNEDKMLAHPSPWRMLWLWVLCGIHSTAADKEQSSFCRVCDFSACHLSSPIRGCYCLGCRITGQKEPARGPSYFYRFLVALTGNKRSRSQSSKWEKLLECHRCLSLEFWQVSSGQQKGRSVPLLCYPAGKKTYS